MEREKQELRDYLEKDSKAMKDKMNAEEAERMRKEKEMAVRLIKALFGICKGLTKAKAFLRLSKSKTLGKFKSSPSPKELRQPVPKPRKYKIEMQRILEKIGDEF